MPSMKLSPGYADQPWLNWVSRNPCPPNEPGAPTINAWIMQATGALKFRKYKPERAVELIQAELTRPEKNNGDEVARAVRRSYGMSGGLDSSNKPKPVLTFNAEALARFAANVPFDVTDGWLAKLSPSRVLDVSPSDFLTALYRPNESVCILDSLESKKTVIWTHGDSSNSLDPLRKGRYGVWYMQQPVTGTEVNGSWRSEANVTAWRYGVLETDKADDAQWRKVLVQLPLPIAAIYTSGKRGCHALFRVDAESKQDWDRLVAEVKARLVPLGADPASLTAVRPTRLPGCMREQTKQLQRLLYLNPQPKKEPIWLGF
jgi:hypothetical protein